MKLLWGFLLLTTLFAVGTSEDLTCPILPFEGQDQTVLEMMGFKESCSLSALRGCVLGCHPNFVGEALKTKKALAEALEYTNKAVDQVKSFTGCLKTNNVVGVGEHLKDCVQYKEHGQEKSGVATLYPEGCCIHPLVIYTFCDQEFFGGGWTLIQSRNLQSEEKENFNRTWSDYVGGFGDPTKDFWVGLENIRILTSLGRTELRVLVETLDGKLATNYDDFKLGEASTQYQVLSFGHQSGIEEGILDDLSGTKFSTYDVHNAGTDCKNPFASGWWHNCKSEGLNEVMSLFVHYRYHNLKRIRMFIRRTGDLV